MEDVEKKTKRCRFDWNKWTAIFISIIALVASIWFGFQSHIYQLATLELSVMPFPYVGVKGGGSVGDLYLFNQGKGPAVNVQVELYESGSTHPIRAHAGTLAPGDIVSLVGPLNAVLGEAMGVTKVYVDPDRMGLIGISMQAGEIHQERQCELRALVEATNIFGKKYSVSQNFAISQTILRP
ncbi:MAG: hypothetical protein WCO26_21400 [Deltaproteobacteria bacterium]